MMSEVGGGGGGGWTPPAGSKRKKVASLKSGCGGPFLEDPDR